MPGQHAVLSPSGASRWLACTPSARLEQQFPDSSGDAAKEGTLAHSLGELIIRYKTKQVTKKEYTKALAEIQANKFYDTAMLEHCENYATHILEKYAAAQAITKDAVLLIEHKLDLTKYVPEGFGTGDGIIIADGILDFDDLKYGKGVPVSVVNNRQMMLYALGALEEFDYLYDIHTVRLCIYQPRLDNISTWEIAVAELKNWAETELIPKARLAFDGQGDYVAGKHCQFCRARGICKANADFNLEIAIHDFKEGPLLTDEAVVDILTRAAEFKSWLKGVEEYALDQAVNKGKTWPGYKVVTGRSNRVYSDADKVATLLTEAGFAEDLIYNKKLLGLGDLEKVIGKKIFEEKVSPLLIKPAGAPALVPESDKRAAFNSSEAAAEDFKDIS